MYPPDVVYVVNGRPVTKADILNYKRERQAKELARKREDSRKIIEKSGYVWTFYNDTPFYGGWWLYLKTAYHDWNMNENRFGKEWIVKIMRIYPCGLLPIYENFRQWKAAFAEQYHYATWKRPQKQGFALVRIICDQYGRLYDVLPVDNKKMVQTSSAL